MSVLLRHVAVSIACGAGRPRCSLSKEARLSRAILHLSLVVDMLHVVTDTIEIPALASGDIQRFLALAEAVRAQDLRAARLSPELEELAYFSASIRLDNFAASLLHKVLELDPKADKARSVLVELYERHGLTWSAASLSGAALQQRGVSIYVPCFNVAQYLERCLQGIFNQSYPVLEVILVDDGSTDGFQEIASRYPVRVISHDKNRGLSAARNTALKNARGELFAGIDADVVLDRLWLERCVSRLADSRYAGVGGRLVETCQFSLADQWRTRLMAQHHGKAFKEKVDLYGCNSVFRTESIRFIGGFDERYRTSFDDIDLSQRLLAAGQITAYEPQAYCFHLRRDSMSSLSRSAYRWRIPPYERVGVFNSPERLAQKWVQELLLAISEVNSLHGEGLAEFVLPTFYMGLSSVFHDIVEFAQRRARQPLELPTAYLFLLKACREMNAVSPLVFDTVVDLLSEEFARECPAHLRDEVLKVSRSPLSTEAIRDLQVRWGGDADLMRAIEATLDGISTIFTFSSPIQADLRQGAEILRAEQLMDVYEARPRAVVLGNRLQLEAECEKLRRRGISSCGLSLERCFEDPIGTLAALSYLAPDIVLLAAAPASQAEIVAFGVQLKAMVPTVELLVSTGVEIDGLTGWKRVGEGGG
jgi:glycosyltransferase involved in cell wall biosynthesis